VTGELHPFEHEDAAYVLGALSREDRIAYEEHLRTCAHCSTAVAELAVLPGLLARLPGLPAPADEPVAPPETVLPGLLTAVRRTRRRRRGWAAAGGIAAAAALIAGTAAVTAQTAPVPQPVGTPVALNQVRDVPVQADVRLQGVAWGTRISMTCRYDGPPASGEYAAGHTYQLVVVDADDGSTQSVARWQALPGRDTSVAGSTDLPPDQIAEVQLLDGAGTLLMEGAPHR
jgi:Putative zinc-finger